MKKKLLWVIGILHVGSVIGQSVPNAGFDYWTSKGLYEEPDKWITLNIMSAFGAPATVTKVGNSAQYSGNYAALIETKSYTSPFGGDTDTIEGVLLTGSGNVFSDPKIGSPFTEKPSKFSVWTKAFPEPGDKVGYFFALTKWDSVNAEQMYLGASELTSSNTVSNWTKLDFIMIYDPQTFDVEPDSILIGFTSSNTDGSDSKGIPGSKLYVDEISFPGSVGVEKFFSTGSNLKMYPNPASHEINFEFADNSVKYVEVRDLTGRLIEKLDRTQTHLKYNTTSLNNGIYFYRTFGFDQNSIDTGKFLIAK